MVTSPAVPAGGAIGVEDLGDFHRLTSVDLNPVMVLPAGSGVVVVDAYGEIGLGNAPAKAERVKN